MKYTCVQESFLYCSLFRCPRHPDRLQKRIVNNIRLGQGLVQLVPTVVSTAAGRHTAATLLILVKVSLGVLPSLGPPLNLLLLEQLILEDERVNVSRQPETLLFLLAGDEREEVGVLRVEQVVDLAGLGDEPGQGPLYVTFLTGSYK